VKISFRAGGDKIFHERLKGAMVQRKWLLQNAPPVPQPYQAQANHGNGTSNSSGVSTPERPKVVGIAGLERLGMELRKNNETIIGSAFEDLEALMASAKDIIALAESFAAKSTDSEFTASALLGESAAALGMATTKDMLGSSSGSDSLYLSELSRTLAEYLTDDRQGILRREGGIISLVDLWASFNRARNGVELVSPVDFEKAARLWEKLSLPVRLRKFKNGLLVVQRSDWTDDKTIAQILSWLKGFHELPPAHECHWDWVKFGKGVTAQETASKFGWSVGVATEELEMAEEKGVLCREEGIEGLRFWENWFLFNDHGVGDEILARLDSTHI
jgi:ESCRT-II complex subunit VPS36